jgi:hypothetical protein
MAASSWGHVQPNLQLQLVKIASLQPLPQLSPLFAMQPVNLRSSIDAKEISAYALLSLNVYQVYVTLFQLVHRSQCRQVLLHKF